MIFVFPNRVIMRKKGNLDVFRILKVNFRKVQIQLRVWEKGLDITEKFMPKVVFVEVATGNTVDFHFEIKDLK